MVLVNTGLTTVLVLPLAQQGTATSRATSRQGYVQGSRHRDVEEEASEEEIYLPY